MISSQRMKIKVYIGNQFLNSSIEEEMEEHFDFHCSGDTPQLAAQRGHEHVQGCAGCHCSVHRPWWWNKMTLTNL